MTRVRSLARCLAILALAFVASAHVGSPDTWFQGDAGPYPVRAVIRLPGVIPGLAQIDIMVTGEGVERVTAQPVIFDAGTGGAPPADIAQPVAGRRGAYHAELWFMQSGSFSVHIGVRGSRGEGTVVVPVAAVAERQIPLYPWLGRILGALGILLFVGAVTIVRAAATDGVTAPGVSPAPGVARKGTVWAVLGGAVICLGLVGARTWWNNVEAEYRSELYRPFAAAATVDTTHGARDLQFVITDSVWRNRRPGASWERFTVSPLVPDHGKLMHLFLIRHGGDPSAFAHLHPVSSDSTTFRAPLGTLPPGRYRAFADVVHETGLGQTLVAEVTVPAVAKSTASLDPDDATFEGTPTGGTFTLPDRATVSWDAKPDSLMAGAEAGLTFTIREPDGTVARLAPYLGMPGHAVVYRTDGEVYIHLHPNGTISMVAQQALGSRRPTDTLPGMLARRLAEEVMSMVHDTHPTFEGRFTFPYAFPSPGAYRVWVQVRRTAGVMTAPFDITVQ